MDRKREADVMRFPSQSALHIGILAGPAIFVRKYLLYRTVNRDRTMVFHLAVFHYAESIALYYR